MNNNRIPITLTLIRLILSPLLLPLLIVYLAPHNNILINTFLALIFIGFSLTDYFDGYFARKYGSVTALGTILDPIADKFLVYSTLISLLAVNKISFFWVVLLIGREFFMMGLRQVALEHNFSIKVSSMGKFKTALQMFCFTYIIFNPYQKVGLGNHGLQWWNTIELLLLLITVGFSISSAIAYFQEFMAQFKHKNSFSSQKGAHK